ncbi:MAG: ComF family protein [Chromatiales bacterium]|nr:ComF family protein [Gammaproteobacteria bacterium]MBW6476378.1 ComF family protein [Chromatiales bacterium]
MLNIYQLYDCIKNIQTQVYPHRCLLCGQAGHAGLDLCPGCLAELPWQGKACVCCGAPLEAQGERCGPCLRRPPPHQASFIPFVYRAPLDRLILGLKFQRQLAAAPLLAQLMAQALEKHPIARPDCLLAVPLHPRRIRERGFNQAGELARALAGLTGIPLAEGLVRRARHTPMQTRLSGAERRRNLRQAFVVDAAGLPTHIALLDDVVTTGSTVRELARCLIDAGVSRVDVWACARA